MDFPLETSDALFVYLLNHACSSPAFIKVGCNTFGKKAEEGFSTYRVETHCVVITYTAKAIERNANGLPTKYVVIAAEPTTC